MNWLRPSVGRWDYLGYCRHNNNNNNNIVEFAQPRQLHQINNLSNKQTLFS